MNAGGKLKVENLVKFFGAHPDHALKPLKAGENRYRAA